jgi:hypothetical protein
MNKEQKYELDIFFSKQIKILRDIGDELDGELAEYLDQPLEKVEKLQEKISNLEKIKTNLIKIYSTIVSEYQ